jgi:3-oxoacyl-[acyl-carrier-protein] synthase-3
MLAEVTKRLGVPPEKVFRTIHDTGNTSAAAVPVALERALAERRIQPGARVALVAVGGGHTAGAALLRF